METEEDKAKSKSVSLQPDLWAQVEARAAQTHGKNRSAYIRDLVEADLAGKTAAAIRDDAIVALAKVYTPAMASGFEKRAVTALLVGKSFNQPLILARLLEGLDHALDRDSFDPERAFGLYNSVEQLRAALGPKGLATAAALMAGLEDPEVRKELFEGVNEDPPIPSSPVGKILQAEKQRRAEQGEQTADPSTHSRSGRVSKSVKG